MATPEPLSYEAKVCLWVAGRIRLLKIHGLVGGPVDVTARGLALYDQLAAGGFRPQFPSEIRSALAAYQRTPPEMVDEELVLLVERWQEPAPTA